MPSLWPQFPKQEIFLTFPSIKIFGAECCANIIQGAFFYCSAQKSTKCREKLKYQNCSSQKILSTRKKQSIRTETMAHVYSSISTSRVSKHFLQLWTLYTTSLDNNSRLDLIPNFQTSGESPQWWGSLAMIKDHSAPSVSCRGLRSPRSTRSMSTGGQCRHGALLIPLRHPTDAWGFG